MKITMKEYFTKMANISNEFYNGFIVSNFREEVLKDFFVCLF